MAVRAEAVQARRVRRAGAHRGGSMTLTWSIDAHAEPAPESWGRFGAEIEHTTAETRAKLSVPASRALLGLVEAAVASGLDTRNAIAAQIGMDPTAVSWRLNYLRRLGRLTVTGRADNARWGVPDVTTR